MTPFKEGTQNEGFKMTPFKEGTPFTSFKEEGFNMTPFEEVDVERALSRKSLQTPQLGKLLCLLP